MEGSQYPGQLVAKEGVRVGLVENFNNDQHFTLLLKKKLLAFLRGFALFFLLFIAVFPVSASAAWSLSGLKALFSAFRPSVVEESATFNKEGGIGGSNALLAPVLPASANSPFAEDPKNDPTAGPDLSIAQNSTLLSPMNPQGVLDEDIRGSITTYTVKEGDNLGAIANSFGITVNTLLWANDIRDARRIKPGDTLVILPISGVRYTVKKGDTLESIAKKYKGSIDDIAQFNGFAIDEVLAIGTEVIIPDGEIQEIPSSKPSTSPTSSITRFAQLPELIGYYLRPIIGGRNPRATKANPHGIHGYNGVDLSNSCGTNLMASAEGTVLIARSSGWNGGYGKYVVIAHPNGTQTLYGHMRLITVAPGDKVLQGQSIGQVGSTGNSTGCHVHFEIRGAKNPF